MKSTPSSAIKKRVLLLCAISVALSVLATVGRLVSLTSFYDKIGYYRADALLPKLSELLYALALVFFAVSACLLLPKLKMTPNLEKHERIAALVPAAAILTHILLDASKLFESAGILETLDMIFSLFALTFFVSLAFCAQPSALTAVSGIGSVLWIAIVWIGSYLDLNVPMNSPDKLFFHFACVGCMVFVFAELRTEYDMPRPRLYLFSMLAAILSIFTCSIPNIIASFNDTFAVYTLLQYDVIFLTIALYALVRLVSFCIGYKEYEEETPVDDEENDIPDDQNEIT